MNLLARLSTLLVFAVPFVSGIASASGSRAPEKISVLIVSGANNHDWEWTTPSLTEILEESGKFDVTVTKTPAETLANAEAVSAYGAILLDYNGPRWGEPAETNFLEAVRGGVGVSVVHAANNAFPGWVEYETLVALCWRKGTGHGRFHAFDVNVTDRNHPITRDLADFRAHNDELYHRLVHMHDAEYRVLATADSTKESGGTGEAEPMIVVQQFGKGRIFHTPLGHVWRGNEWQRVSHRNPQFRDLIVRGTEWAATGRVTSSAREPNALTAAEREFGWESLFDGETTKGWRGFKKEGFPEQGWTIEDGALRKVAGAGGGDIITERQYKDFEFAFEWKVAPGANSGIMYRVSETMGTTWQTGPEYQVLDDAKHHDGKNTKTSAAALYAMIAAEPKRVAPTGGWNTGRILVVGNHVEHWLNGARVVSYELGGDEWKALVEGSKFKTMPEFGVHPIGHIALQDHGDDVWYRNLRVRDLTAREDREVELFNGRDLSGWTYHLRDDGKMEDVWSVTDEGVLVCKGRPIGYLRTEKDYTNYTLRLKWRFDPEKGAGNSGVLMRKIGPDKVWPRSIEAQLHSGSAGDFWNIGEYPMSVVPERTNGRNTKKVVGNEKPLGEWNQYEITVWHGHVVLRVNGKILNEAWDCMEIPGKICLQSEGAEIHFRDIRLMPLP